MFLGLAKAALVDQFKINSDVKMFPWQQSVILINTVGKGGGVAELVTRPPTVPKVRGSNHGAD